MYLVLHVLSLKIGSSLSRSLGSLWGSIQAPQSEGAPYTLILTRIPVGNRQPVVRTGVTELVFLPLACPYVTSDGETHKLTLDLEMPFSQGGFNNVCFPETFS